jgi:DNA-binding CsgD family transcriptional regulator
MKLHEHALARIEPRTVRRPDVPSGLTRGHGHVPGRSNAGRHPTLAIRSSLDPVPAALETMSIQHFPVPDEAQLRALFGLTSAEARLAQHLARGDSVEEIAQTLCIKMSTARTQLAAIFAKTDTRRQAKLVAILSRLAHLE